MKTFLQFTRKKIFPNIIIPQSGLGRKIVFFARFMYINVSRSRFTYTIFLRVNQCSTWCFQYRMSTRMFFFINYGCKVTTHRRWMQNAFMIQYRENIGFFIY